jgi:hypothetical protein
MALFWRHSCKWSNPVMEVCRNQKIEEKLASNAGMVLIKMELCETFSGC